MRTSWQVLMVVGLALGLAVEPGASARAGDPGPEVALWSQAAGFLASGDEIKACRVAGKLNKYLETPTFATARQALLTHGLSIEDCLGSCTMKRIIALQSQVEATRGGTLPKPGPRPDHLDCWGKPLQVELVTRPGFVYVVRSAGPDKKYMTGDDYAVDMRESGLKAVDRGLGMRDVTDQDQGQAGATNEDPARDAGRKSMYSRTPPKDPVPAVSGSSSQSGSGVKEEEVTLDKLLKQ
ncbi:MAG: hypothetical protein KQJ78_06025 [Deltaproteobacteria bacterium]|nr:hypothetical protein [Deltaproteobacteria bacterium]